MRGRRKEQSAIGHQHHRRTAAAQDRGQAGPAKPVDRQTFLQDIRQQDRARHGKADRRDVPRCQVRPNPDRTATTQVAQILTATSPYSAPRTNSDEVGLATEASATERRLRI
tara:strand:+ start:179 stop:514 length:336 start_codon:yes stop_codon:yes gene_type:complete